MIIKELYVDHFLGNDDLTLADLSDQLNVIRLPSTVESEFLQAFIPSMLYGSEEQRVVSGSALVQVGTENFELLRIAEGNMSGLHVLDERGEAANCPLNDWLQRLDANTYLSLFTDQWLISDRLEHWRSSGLMEAFGELHPAQSSQPEIDDSVLTGEIHNLKRQVERLVTKRCEVLVELASSGHPREDYLNARETAHLARQRVDQIETQLERAQKQVKPIEIAMRLTKPWQRQTELTGQIEELRALRARPKDLQRLQMVERRLDESRGRLRELREQTNDGPMPEPVVRRIDPEAERLRGQQAEAIERLRRREQLERDIVDANQAEQTDRASVVAAVKQVKDTAGRLRQARRRFRAATEQARRLTPADAPNPVFESAPDEIESQSVEQIRERIRLLKAETNQLLKRRLLPPLIVLVLGALFAGGAACLMAALLLDLSGFDSSAGAIGVTIMLASALLKLSFERPPDRDLRAHRKRIQELLKEVESRNLTEPPQSPVDDAVPIPINQSVQPKIVAPDADEAESELPKVSPAFRQELEDAYQAWVGLLAQYDLDPEIQPREAVVEIRQRHSEQSQLRPDEASTLRLEQEELTRWLDQYRESLIVFLSSRQQATVHVTFEGATWETLFSFIDAERDSVIEADTEPPSPDPTPEQIGDAQRQVKELKRSRKKILERSGARDVDDLKSRIEQKTQLSELEAELHRVQQRMSRELEHVDCTADVERLLHAEEDIDLNKQRSRKRSEVARLSRELEEARSERHNADDEVRQISADHSRLDLRLELNLINEQLAQVSQQLRVVQLGQQAVGRIHHHQPDVGEPSDVLLEATRLLENAYEVPCRLNFERDGQQFHLQRGPERAIPLREMGRSDAELVIMCLQLALVRYLDRQVGIRLPMVLDDHSLGYPAEQAMRIGRLLSGVAAEGVQVFLFTCNESVSDLFSQFAIPTLVIQRSVSGLEEPPPISNGRIEEVIDMDTIPPSPEPIENSQPDSTDWIPVEYHVADTRDAGPTTDAGSNRDSIMATPTADATTSDELAPKLDQVGRTSTANAKKFRIDQPHGDRHVRPPTPRRRTATSGNDEVPDWWPD